MARLLIDVTDADNDHEQMLCMMVETDEQIQPDHLAEKIESAIYRMDLYGHRKRIQAFHSTASPPAHPTDDR